MLGLRVNCHSAVRNVDVFSNNQCSGPPLISSDSPGATAAFNVASITEGTCFALNTMLSYRMQFFCDNLVPPSPPAPPAPPIGTVPLPPTIPAPRPEIGGRIFMYPVSSVCSGTPIIRSFAPNQCIDSPGSTSTDPSYMTIPCYSEAYTSVTIHIYDDINCTIYNRYVARPSSGAPPGQYPVTPGSCFNPDTQSPNGYMLECGQYSPLPPPPLPPLPNPPPPPPPVTPQTLEVAADAAALAGDSSEGGFPIYAVVIPVVVIAIVLVLVLCLYRKRAQAQTSASLLALSSGGLLSRPPTCSWKLTEGSAYLAFLSHYKVEAGSDARYLHDLLQRMVPVRRSGFESSP